MTTSHLKIWKLAATIALGLVLTALALGFTDNAARIVNASKGDFLPAVQQPSRSTAAGTISGTVYSSAGITLPNITVSAISEQGGIGSCTDSQGVYTITDLTYGLEWDIHAGGENNWCGGSVYYIQEYWQETRYWYSATLLVFSTTYPSQSGIDFTLELGGAISGTITDSLSGNPLGDVEVCLPEYNGNGLYDGCVWSGDDGKYAVYNVPGGSYEVLARKSGYVSEYYDDAYNYWDNISITVSAGQTTPDINFDLAPGGMITGVVSEAGSGNPLEGFYVELQIKEGIQEVEATDEFGRYSFEDLPFGINFYLLAWNWPDGGQHTIEFYDGIFHWDQATPISVTAELTTQANINFSLDWLGTVTETQVSSTTGGIIRHVDTQGITTTITVPGGAVSETTDLVYQQYLTPTGEIPPSFSFARTTFDLKAYIDGISVDPFTFTTPISFSLHYSESALSGPEETLSLMTWNPDSAEWQDAACGPYYRQLDQDWLAVPVCHLSHFALLGEPYKVYLPVIFK